MEKILGSILTLVGVYLYSFVLYKWISDWWNEGLWSDRNWFTFMCIIFCLLITAVGLALIRTGVKDSFRDTGKTVNLKKYTALALSGFVIAIVVAAVIIQFYDPGGCYGHTRYNSNREQIEAGIHHYMNERANNNAAAGVPIVNMSVFAVNGSMVIPSEDYYVAAICPLLTSSKPAGILKQVPATVHSRNCFPDGANAQPNVTNCSGCGSYLWLTTLNGDVASICIGDECTAHNEDGYQCVYP